MSISQPISQSVSQAVSQAITGRVFDVDTLAFHALDDVEGTFSADVIVGTGSLTEACTSTRYCPDDSNIYQAFGSGVPAEYYAGAKWWLYGAPAATNLLTYSRDLTNAPWTTSNVTNTYDQVGLTGASNTASLVDDQSASHGFTQCIITGLAAGTNPCVARYRIKKDTDAGRTNRDCAVYMLRDTAGTTDSMLIQVNLETGAVTVVTPGTQTAYEVRDAGDDWEIFLEITNQSNTRAILRVYPAYTLANGTAHPTAVGDVTVRNVEYHENKTIAQVRGSSPIFTSGSTTTQNQTNDSFDDADHTPTQGGYFVEWMPMFATAEVSGDIEIISLNNSAGLIYYDATNSLLKATDGTNTASVALTVVSETVYKVWVAYGETSLQVGFNATTGTAGTFDGAFATGTKIELTTPAPATTLTRNMRHVNSDFDASVTTMQALAA